jgi:hypothetical protein
VKSCHIPPPKDGVISKRPRASSPISFLRFGGDAVRKLICRCPETQQPVDLELYTDYATLARIWSNSLRFQCPHCGAEHETNVGAAWLEDTLGGISTTRVS